MHLLKNILNNGFEQNGLMLVSIVSIIFGIIVIISKNPIRSILFLIGLFLAISVYLFMMNISFIALAYILVYVGAVSILFLFILMLINIRLSELSTDNSNSIPLSIIIITIFSIVISGKSLFSANNENPVLHLNAYFKEKSELIITNNIINQEPITNSLFNVKDVNEKVSLSFSCMWDNMLTEMSHITSIGNILYVSYSTGILIVGLILLLSMVGAISITSISNKN